MPEANVGDDRQYSADGCWTSCSTIWCAACVVVCSPSHEIRWWGSGQMAESRWRKSPSGSGGRRANPRFGSRGRPVLAIDARWTPTGWTNFSLPVLPTHRRAGRNLSPCPEPVRVFAPAWGVSVAHADGQGAFLVAGHGRVVYSRVGVLDRRVEHRSGWQPRFLWRAVWLDYRIDPAAGSASPPCVPAGRWPAWQALQCRRVTSWPGLCI